MGKSHKGNRTKGNTKASSSGHTSELLGVRVGGFVGFGGAKDGGWVPPATGQDGTVDADFRMAMRKMLKRDPTTRLKAVQEFGDYCVEKDRETAKAVLPFWPRLFNRLALDTDRRVREVTHLSNGKLLGVVGRDMAPFLKGLMGPWLVGQCDPHPPAASVAQGALNNAFPPGKQAEALLFCREEVFAFFKDNLFEQTAKTMSDNTISPEDAESKYVLVVAATLQAVKVMMLVTMETEKNDLVRNDVVSIVQNPKFWKFANIKTQQPIRSAWYRLVACVCRLMPDAFSAGGNLKKLSASVFGCLSESDPQVATPVWEAVLSVAAHVQEVWEDSSSVQKGLLPRLWEFLEKGGGGNGGALLPCLLPLLSTLPPHVSQSDTFLQRFFSALTKGLSLDSVKRSPSECDAILRALFECLQFMCCTRLAEKGPILMQEVLLNQVVPLLEMALHAPSDAGGHLSVSQLCPALASLLAKLECNSDYAGTLGSFWCRLMPVFEKVFVAPDDNWDGAVVFLGYFFHSLFASGAPKAKKTVRFQDEAQTEEAPSPAPSESPRLFPCQAAASFPHVIQFCTQLCGEIEKERRRSHGYTRLLEEVLTSASSSELVEELARKCIGEEKSESGDATFTRQFAEKLVLKWIRESEGGKLDSLINIALFICSSLPSEQSKELLDSCCAISLCVAERVLKMGLPVCRGAPFFRDWCQGALAPVGQLFHARELSRGEVPGKAAEELTRLLEFCLLDEDSELLVDDETFQKLLTFLMDLTAEFFNQDSSSCEKVLFILHDLTTALLKKPERCWKFDGTDQLIFSLFYKFLTNSELPKDEGDVFFRVLSAGLDSYVEAGLDVSSDSSLMRRMADEIKKRMWTAQEHTGVLLLQQHALFLLRTAKESLARHTPGADIFGLAGALLPTSEEWDAVTEGLTIATLPFFLRGALFSPLPLEREVLACPADVTRRAPVLASCWVSGILANIVLDSVEVSLSHLPHLLWCLTICKDATLPQEASPEQLIEDNFLSLLNQMSDTELDQILEGVFLRALQRGQWALCLSALFELFPVHARLRRFATDKFETLTPVCKSEERSMVRQVLIPQLPQERQLVHFRDLLDAFPHSQTTDETSLLLGELCCLFESPVNSLGTDHLVALQKPFEDITQSLGGQHHTLRHLLLETVLSFAADRDLCLVNEDGYGFFAQEMEALLEDAASLDLSTPASLALLRRTARLYRTMHHLSQLVPESLLSWKPPKVPGDWDAAMALLFLHVAALPNSAFLSPSAGTVLGTLVSAVGMVPAQVLLGTLLCKLDALVPLLKSGVRQLQCGAHIIMQRMVPLLPEVLQSPPDEEEKEEKIQKIPTELAPLVSLLGSLGEVAETLLAEVKVGDPCLVVPHLDSYCLVMGHLLGWGHLMDFIGHSPAQMRLSYTADLEERGLLTAMFTTMFRLLPENPASCVRRMRALDSPKKEDFRALFLQAHDLQTSEASSEEIQLVACYTYALALRSVPASVRTWFNNLDRKSVDIVNNFTTKYVSSHLCAAEIQAVHTMGKTLQNMAVLGRPGSREVVATYTVDEASLELCVHLPPNHPLCPVTMERRGRAGVGEQEWRQWMLQLKTTLTYQNGSLLDGLASWGRNLDKKFEGVEECTICYYVLHAASLRLPRLSCHVCRKKFHSECLYKWFRTSNNSTCPLCRNEFHMY